MLRLVQSGAQVVSKSTPDMLQGLMSQPPHWPTGIAKSIMHRPDTVSFDVLVWELPKSSLLATAGVALCSDPCCSQMC